MTDPQEADTILVASDVSESPTTIGTGKELDATTSVVEVGDNTIWVDGQLVEDTPAASTLALPSQPIEVPAGDGIRLMGSGVPNASVAPSLREIRRWIRITRASLSAETP